MLDEVLTKIGAAIQDDWKRNVNPDEEVTFDVTQDAVNYNDAPPRVVFERLAERWTLRSGASQDGHLSPRILYTRLPIVRAHVWGATPTGTEQLLCAVARQSYRLCYGSYTPKGGQWVNSSATKLGQLYLFDAEYQIPVPREVEPAIDLDAMPIIPDLVGI